MSLLLLFPQAAVALTEVYLKYTPIKIVASDDYRFSFRVRSDTAQQLHIKVVDSAGGNASLDIYRHIEADTWEVIKSEFSGVASDTASQIFIYVSAEVQEIFVDDFKLYNLSVERKEYRIMRIQGRMRPGSFLQTLTLREKTAAETA